MRQQMAGRLVLCMLLLVAGQPLHIMMHHSHDRCKDQLADTDIGKHASQCLICAYVTANVSCQQKPADEVSRPLSDGFVLPVLPLPVVGFSGNHVTLRAPPVTG